MGQIDTMHLLPPPLRGRVGAGGWQLKNCAQSYRTPLPRMRAASPSRGEASELERYEAALAFRLR